MLFFDFTSFADSTIPTESPTFFSLHRHINALFLAACVNDRCLTSFQKAVVGSRVDVMLYSSLLVCLV